MRRSYRAMTGVQAFLILICGGIVQGQVDRRAYRGNSLGRGHALDGNPGLGTRGLNRPRGRSFDAGSRMNAIISGNFTGLARFHAASPVPFSNQFRTSLPSSSLSGFQSRSVGAGELQQNRPPRPTYYFDRQTSIADVGHITRKLNIPGSSMLRSPRVAPSRITTPRRPPGDAKWPDPTDRRLGAQESTINFGNRQRRFTRAGGNEPATSTASLFERATRSTIFGVSEPRGSVVGGRLRPGLWTGEQPASRLRPWVTQRDAVMPLSSSESRGAVGSQGVRAADPRLETRLGLAMDARSEVGTRQRNVGGKAQPFGRQAVQSEPEHLGYDRFSDLYKAVQAAQSLGVVELGFELVQATRADSPQRLADRPADPSGIAPSGHLVMRRRSDEGVKALATAAAWAKDLLEDPIATFAGKYQDRFNHHMTEAEAALRSGKYYDAAGHYELAHTIDSRGPLPLLGRGHALLAAGDYVTASWLLQKGIERFPHIAAFRLDLVALVGRRDVFDVRRADLEDRLEHGEDHELRFLLGYLELYSGLPEEGIRNLERAARFAPEGGVISSFPEFLMGRRPLPPVGGG